MKDNVLIVVSIVLLLIVLGALFYASRIIPPEVKQDTVTTVRVDTLWKDTTVTEYKFVPKEVIKHKVDTVYDSNGNEIPLVTESKRYDKRLVIDKDTADVEIHTTGINTTLDSLKMRLKTHTNIVEKTIEITKYEKKKKTFWDRFHLGVGIGYGYGLKNKNLEPFVGISLTYSLRN